MSLVATALTPCRDAMVERLPAHVVLLTNFIPPYRLPVYCQLARRVEKLTILLSTPMEPNRNWPAHWGALDVRLQRTLSFRRDARHAAGFSDRLHVHMPIDTLAQLRTLQPDIILSAEMGIRSLGSAVYARYFKHTPFVLWLTISERTEEGRGRLRRALRRWLLARADAVVVNGESGARYVERFGFDRRRTFKAPYTALAGLFDHLPLSRPAAPVHRLLYVGQLIERKGLAPFIESLAVWCARNPHRRIEFDVVGSGPLRAQLESLPTPPNLLVHFLGERDYSELPEIYAVADLFAFPTLADEWGLVANEAMAAGLPVLGSVYSQAVEELCREGVNGWLFRPDSPADTLDAIHRALSATADQLASMRAAARASVDHLTPEYAVDRVLEALSSIYHHG
ncbi:MAG TPA: glycosyltransferase family 4 protein [Pirellulales bacterium]|nr:glycosyltransferase family 4 protein [Pirellulales bacterium]